MKYEISVHTAVLSLEELKKDSDQLDKYIDDKDGHVQAQYDTLEEAFAVFSASYQKARLTGLEGDIMVILRKLRQVDGEERKTLAMSKVFWYVTVFGERIGRFNSYPEAKSFAETHETSGVARIEFGG